MASFRESFVDRGFSAEVAETASRARRELTCQVYDSLFLLYQPWCLERGVNPAQSPLTEVGEILYGQNPSSENNSGV